MFNIGGNLVELTLQNLKDMQCNNVQIRNIREKSPWNGGNYVE